MSMSTGSDHLNPPEELQGAPSPEEIKIEVLERMIAKGTATTEQMTDEILDVLAKFEKQGCDVSEIKKSLEDSCSYEKLFADFVKNQTLPSGCQETFEKAKGLGVRILKYMKDGEIEATMISDLRETKDMFSQLRKLDMGSAFGAYTQTLEKNLNDFIDYLAEIENRKIEKERKLREKKRAGMLGGDNVVTFICFYFACFVVFGVAFTVYNFF